MPQPIQVETRIPEERFEEFAALAKQAERTIAAELRLAIYAWIESRNGNGTREGNGNSG